MENKKETVSITYSAEEQKELNAIRAKYVPKGSKPLTNLDKAKAIDAKVESKGTIAGLAVGIIEHWWQVWVCPVYWSGIRWLWVFSSVWWA